MASEPISDEEARELIRAQVQNSTKSMVAKRVGVTRDVLNRFLKGSGLYGDNREAIMAFVRPLKHPPAPKHSSGGRILTEYQLGVISGQARSVLRLLDMAREEQAKLIRDVDSFGAQTTVVYGELTPQPLTDSETTALEKTAIETVRAHAEQAALNEKDRPGHEGTGT